MSALETLAERLKVPAEQLGALKAYDDRKIAAVDAVIDTALNTEREAFAQAVETSLDFLPRLIRPIAKKMMFGG